MTSRKKAAAKTARTVTGTALTVMVEIMAVTVMEATIINLLPAVRKITAAEVKIRKPGLIRHAPKVRVTEISKMTTVMAAMAVQTVIRLKNAITAGAAMAALMVAESLTVARLRPINRQENSRAG